MVHSILHFDPSITLVSASASRSCEASVLSMGPVIRFHVWIINPRLSRYRSIVAAAIPLLCNTKVVTVKPIATTTHRRNLLPQSSTPIHHLSALSRSYFLDLALLPLSLYLPPPCAIILQTPHRSLICLNLVLFFSLHSFLLLPDVANVNHLFPRARGECIFSAPSLNFNDAAAPESGACTPPWDS